MSPLFIKFVLSMCMYCFVRVWFSSRTGVSFRGRSGAKSQVAGGNGKSQIAAGVRHVDNTHIYRTNTQGSLSLGWEASR